jgi:acyl carrier protein
MVQDVVLRDIGLVLSSVAGIDPASVTSETSFTNDLGIDSMTMLDAVVALEDRFGVLIPDDTWPRFSTVGDLAAHLEQVGVGHVNAGREPGASAAAR